MHINNFWEGFTVGLLIASMILGLVKDIHENENTNFAVQTMSSAFWIWVLSNAGLFR